jgi:hypothetical protein
MLDAYLILRGGEDLCVNQGIVLERVILKERQDKGGTGVWLGVHF